jgi:hypothetical protein
VSISTLNQAPGTGFLAVIRSVWDWRGILVRLNSPLRFEGGKLMNALQGGDAARAWDLVKSLSFIIDKTYPGLKTLVTGLDVGGLEANKLLGPTSIVVPDGVPHDKRHVPNVGPAFSAYKFSSKILGEVTPTSILGRLVALKEAAGKIRIIAIVDPLTQWALKPLHDWIFAVLGKIPQDGTFDQALPISRLMKISSKSRDRFIGSCDMSAATDRLPVSLQSQILAHKFGSQFA